MWVDTTRATVAADLIAAWHAEHVDVRWHRVALDAARGALPALPGPGDRDQYGSQVERVLGRRPRWPQNVEVVEGLRKCFDAPFAKANGPGRGWTRHRANTRGPVRSIPGTGAEQLTRNHLREKNLRGFLAVETRGCQETPPRLSSRPLADQSPVC